MKYTNVRRDTVMQKVLVTDFYIFDGERIRVSK